MAFEWCFKSLEITIVLGYRPSVSARVQKGDVCLCQIAYVKANDGPRLFDIILYKTIVLGLE